MWVLVMDDIKDTARLEVTATKDTTFFGLNDRLLTPLLFSMVFSLLIGTWWIIIAFFITLIIEVVKKFLFGVTWKELSKSTWASINESTRKTVRN
jgi:hypothetical protein